MKETPGPTEKEARRRSLPEMSLGQWQGSDRVARTRWIAEVNPTLKQIASSVSSDPDLVPDIVQDSWVAFMDGLDSGALAEKEAEFSLVSAIVTIARRKAIDQFRRKNLAERNLVVLVDFTAMEYDAFEESMHLVKQADIAAAEQQRSVEDIALGSLSSTEELKKLVEAMGAARLGTLIFLADPTLTHADRAQATGQSAGNLRFQKHILLKEAKAVLQGEPWETRRGASEITPQIYLDARNNRKQRLQQSEEE